MKPVEKYATLFSLYIAQSVPMSFFSTVLPVIMRMEKFSLASIALIQLIKIPWIVKFLWAPLVDNGAASHMHYKRWIIGSEIFYALTIISLAFFNLHVDFNTIVILMVLAITFSATQDIASDALAIRILKSEERPMGNSMQSMGTFCGTLLGSGVLLMLYASTGWQWVMFALAVFVLVALIPLGVLVNKKTTADVQLVKPKTGYRDLFGFFAVSGSVKRLILLVIYYSGVLGTLSLLKPYMVDLGFDLKKIAFMVGIYGTACGAIGAFLAGFIIKKIGGKLALRVFAAFNVLAAILFVYTTINHNMSVLYAAIGVLWLAYAMSSVIIYTISMENVRPGREGTDYSIQIVITHLMGIILAIVCGKLADHIGFNGLFMVEACVALVVLVSVFFLYNENKKVN